MNNLKLTQIGIDTIKSHEALRLQAYKATNREVVWTIGWGHTYGVGEGDVITTDQAEEFLRADVQWAEQAVNDLVRVKLEHYQFDALVSFVFNIGAAQFQSSTLLEELNKYNYDVVPHQMQLFKYQTWYEDGVRMKKVVNGLVSRRLKESAAWGGVGYMSLAEPSADAIVENRDDKSVAQVLKDSRKAKVGAVTSVMSGVDAADKILEKTQSLTTKLTDFMTPDILLPLAFVVMGAIVVYLQVSDSRKGRAY